MFNTLVWETVQRTILKDEPSLSVKFKVAKTNAIDEVVVTGLVSQKKVSVVGAVSTINMDELRTPGTSLVNMIGGRMPGVITMQTSGEQVRTYPTSGYVAYRPSVLELVHWSSSMVLRVASAILM